MVRPLVVALLAAVAATEEREWASKAGAVRGAIRSSWRAYATAARGYDALAPGAGGGGDRMGSRLTLYESLDTLYVAGLGDEFDGAVAEVFAGGLGDPLARGVGSPAAGPANVAAFLGEVVGGLLGGFEASGDRRLLWAAAYGAEMVLDAVPANGWLAPRRARLFHRTTQTARYALARVEAAAWDVLGLGPRKTCATLDDLYASTVVLRVLSRETGDDRFAFYADGVFADVASAWRLEGGRASRALLPKWLGCDADAPAPALGAGGVGAYAALLVEQLVGTNAASHRAAALYDRFEALAANATLPARTRYRGFAAPGLLALGATHPFRKGETDGDARGKALAFARRWADAIEDAHRAAGGLAPAVAAEVRRDGTGVAYSATDARYRLSGEYAETLFYLYRATGDDVYRARGWALFEALEAKCLVPGTGAYAGLEDVFSGERGAAMAPAFLGATLKYLYLLLAPRDTYPIDDWLFSAHGHVLATTERCERDDLRACAGPERPPRRYGAPVDLLGLGLASLFAVLRWPARRRRKPPDRRV